MENQISNSIEVYPVYGPIPRDGEYVETGDVIGLAADAESLVLAPVSGWIKRVASHRESEKRVGVLILPSPAAALQSGS